MSLDYCISYLIGVLFCQCRYNGRSIIFIVSFCVSTLYIAIMLFILNKVDYEKYVDGTEDYAECLIEASARSPIQTQEACDEFAQQECGQYPSVRPDKIKVTTFDHPQLFFHVFTVFQYSFVGIWIWDYSLLHIFIRTDFAGKFQKPMEIFIF